MTKREPAILSGKVLYREPIPVGQLYFPSQARYEEVMNGIFDREYYTNHGPLARELESKLETFLGVENVICVSNATIGLMMAAEALGLKKKIIVPSFTFIATPQSLTYCGIEPVFCDVDKRTHHLTAESLDMAYDQDVTGVLGVNLWGKTALVESIDAWAKDKGLVSYWDSAQAFGSFIDGKRVGSGGELEVFSMHATKILSATEGGFISTNDHQLAEKLRNIRSSYGVRSAVSVVKTANGRMSEFQAAIGLLSLADYDKNRNNNERLLNLYSSSLIDVPGVSLVTEPSISSNCQYAVIDVDPAEYGLTRDQLLRCLHAENIIARRYFYPGCHKQKPYYKSFNVELINTDYLSSRLLQLPLGARTDDDDIYKIVECLLEFRLFTNEIKRRIEDV